VNPLRALTERDVSIWLDMLSRDLVEDGGLTDLIERFAVTGVTSNPTIFAKAMAGSDRYDEQLRRELDGGIDDPAELFVALAVEDVRRAARLLAPHGGSVSLEVTPDVAHDTRATIGQALALWRLVDAPNAMIKVPATPAGVDAIEELTALGVNVNVTLLFSVERYEAAAEAYRRGLERRLERGERLDGARSVASFFVSRVDAKVDSRVPEGSPLRGRIATANARLAYVRFREGLATARWRRLAGRGARAQRPLWASTAVKHPAYRDVRYLEQLALPGSILTVPESTLRAFADHGDPERTEPLDRHDDERLTTAVDLPAIALELEREGVEAFRASYDELLDDIERRVRDYRATTRRAGFTPRISA
jgi:transaldolase